jgi:hypothetical protein
MTADDFARMEYEDRRLEERDRMNARVQFWQLYFGLVSVFSVAFGFAGLHIGPYVLAVLPVFLTFLARYIGHSEAVLKQIRKYLEDLEKRLGYTGYEAYVREKLRPTHGGYLSALRDAFLTTDVLALVVAGARVVLDGRASMGVPLLVVELVVLAAMTWVWISGRRVLSVLVALPGQVARRVAWIARVVGQGVAQ